MIDNVGFLDQTKNIVTDEDFDFQRANFPIAEETKFSNYGVSFFSYNRFMGIFASWLLMKPNATMQTGERFIKLPVVPQIAGSIILGFYNNVVDIYYVDEDGYLVANSDITFPSVSTYVYFIGSFGINGGGVTLKGLLAKIKHFFHKGEVLVC